MRNLDVLFKQDVGVIKFTVDHYQYIEYDVIMGGIASQITSLTIVFATFYSDADESSTSLAFVREIDRGPVNSPHKWPVTRKMFPYDDVIMQRIRFEEWFHGFTNPDLV